MLISTQNWTAKFHIFHEGGEVCQCIVYPIILLSFFTQMKLVLKFELKGQNGVDVVCVEDQAVVGSTFDEEELHRKWSPGQE